MVFELPPVASLIIYIGLAVAMTLVSGLVSVTLVGWVLRGLPTDYFTSDDHQGDELQGDNLQDTDRQHTTHRDAEQAGDGIKPSPKRVSHRLVRTIAGGTLLLLGLIQLVTPGQGVLMIVAGLILIDFPGKRRLERRLVANPRVLHGLNWTRAKIGREPFEPPSERSDAHRRPQDQSRPEDQSR